MSAVAKSETEKPLIRREAGPGPFEGMFSPSFPVSRMFGLSPFALMREFAEDVERTFRGTGQAAEIWAPKVDVQSCNGNLVVKAELPGLKKEEVNVKVTEDALIIEGERKSEHKDDHEGYHRYERSYGKFYRAMPLPKGARTDQATAELTDGVLKISIPTPEEKKNVRQIAVEEKKTA
jgi:HSP20 family protein